MNGELNPGFKSQRARQTSPELAVTNLPDFNTWPNPRLIGFCQECETPLYRDMRTGELYCEGCPE